MWQCWIHSHLQAIPLPGSCPTVARLTWLWPPACDDDADTPHQQVRSWKWDHSGFTRGYVCLLFLSTTTCHGQVTHREPRPQLWKSGASLAFGPVRSFPSKGACYKHMTFFGFWGQSRGVQKDPAFALNLHVPSWASPTPNFLRCKPLAPIAERRGGQRASQPPLTPRRVGWFPAASPVPVHHSLKGFGGGPRRLWQLMTSRADAGPNWTSPWAVCQMGCSKLRPPAQVTVCQVLRLNLTGLLSSGLKGN